MEDGLPPHVTSLFIAALLPFIELYIFPAVVVEVSYVHGTASVFKGLERRIHGLRADGITDLQQRDRSKQNEG